MSERARLRKELEENDERLVEYQARSLRLRRQLGFLSDKSKELIKRELSSIEEQEKLEREQESSKEVTSSSSVADASSLFDPSALDLLGPSVPLDWVGWDVVDGTAQPSSVSPGSG